VLNNLVAHSVATGRILLKSDGSPLRPIVHIEDIARAFIAVLAARPEDVSAQAFNVGRTDENFRIIDLAECVARVVGDCKIEIAPGASADKRSHRVSFEKIALKVPGFRPHWTAEAGAEQLCRSYRAAGLLAADIEGPRYQRVAQVKELMGARLLDPSLRHVEGARQAAE
jgi:nucleoside-diphosphate-sugar epimerase